MLEIVLKILQEHVQIAEIVQEIIQNRKKEVNLPFFREDELYNPLSIFH